MLAFLFSTMLFKFERLTDSLQAADIIKAANGDLNANTAEDSDSVSIASPSPPGQKPSPVTTPPPTPVNVNVVTMTTFVTVYV
jgi:hypothetical protein